MVSEATLGIQATDLEGMIQRLYLARVQFPISSKEALVEVLGGADQPMADEGAGSGINADQVGTLVFANGDNFGHPDDVLNALLERKWVSPIAKTLALDTIRATPFPLQTPQDVADHLRGLAGLGVSLLDLAAALTFPVDDGDTLLAALGVLEPEMFGPDVPTITGLAAEGVAPQGAARDMVPGYSYMVLEEKAKQSYEAFVSLVKAGFKGLGISRTNPKNLRSEFDLTDADIYWLTDRTSNTEETLSSSLENLMFNLEGFMSENPLGAVVLDGLEFLVSIHGFDPVSRFTQQLKDVASEGSHILIFPVSPYVLDKQQLKSLERELEPIPEGETLAIGDAVNGVLAEAPSDGGPAPEQAAPAPAPAAPAPAEESGPAPAEEPEPAPAEEPEPAPEPAPESAAEAPPAKPETPPAPSPAAEPAPAPEAQPEPEPELAGEVEPPSGEGVKEASAGSGEGAVEEAGDGAETGAEAGGKEPCSSCDGKGKCYWCAGSIKCHTCEGDGKIGPKQCRSCKGTGSCASCNGTGICYWCDGAGSVE